MENRKQGLNPVARGTGEPPDSDRGRSAFPLLPTNRSTEQG
jgi:hypothetical protein